MDEIITYVLLDRDGTEVSEEFDTPREAFKAREGEWDVEGGGESLTVMRKTYVHSCYELVGPSDAR